MNFTNHSGSSVQGTWVDCTPELLGLRYVPRLTAIITALIVPDFSLRERQFCTLKKPTLAWKSSWADTSV